MTPDEWDAWIAGELERDERRREGVRVEFFEAELKRVLGAVSIDSTSNEELRAIRAQRRGKGVTKPSRANPPGVSDTLLLFGADG